MDCGVPFMGERNCTPAFISSSETAPGMSPVGQSYVAISGNPCPAELLIHARFHLLGKQAERSNEFATCDACLDVVYVGDGSNAVSGDSELPISTTLQRQDAFRPSLAHHTELISAEPELGRTVNNPARSENTAIREACLRCRKPTTTAA